MTLKELTDDLVKLLAIVEDEGVNLSIGCLVHQSLILEDG